MTRSESSAEGEMSRQDPVPEDFQKRPEFLWEAEDVGVYCSS